MMKITLFVYTAVVVSLVTACPSGWYKHGNSCYHFSHDLENWAGARAICIALGGYLVQINSIEESLYLTTEMKLLPARGGYWTGLNDLQEEGIYRWTNDNTLFDPSLKSLWNSGQPNNLNNNENCVFYADHTDGLQDGACGFSPGIKYICERPDTDEGHGVVG